eukprot:381770-Amphidinium_carterae.3
MSNLHLLRTWQVVGVAQTLEDTLVMYATKCRVLPPSASRHSHSPCQCAHNTVNTWLMSESRTCNNCHAPPRWRRRGDRRDGNTGSIQELMRA